ncbi:MAG: hypothetical protein IJS61_00885 [Firmicutes bacterium]|nr:hypothetical protein [Bacillota bacterium]
MKNKKIYGILFIILSMILILPSCKKKEETTKVDMSSVEYFNDKRDTFLDTPQRQVEGIIDFGASAVRDEDPDKEAKVVNFKSRAKATVEDNKVLADVTQTNGGGSVSRQVYYNGENVYTDFNGGVTQEENTYLFANDFLEYIDVFMPNFPEESIENKEVKEEDGLTVVSIGFKKDTFPQTVKSYMPLLTNYIDYDDDQMSIDIASLVIKYKDGELYSTAITVKGLFNKDTEYPTAYSYENTVMCGTDNISITVPENIAKFIE